MGAESVRGEGEYPRRDMSPATIFHALDRHSGSTSAILTAALVLVTGYAFTNRRVVTEMKAARDAALLPKLALEFHRLGPNVVDLAIRNVGPGAALNIDVHVEWLPTDQAMGPTRIHWRRNLLSPGEQAELAPPGDLNGNLEHLPTLFRDILLRGNMQDATGKPYAVDEAFGTITEWRDLLGDAHELWRPPEPERRMADALAKEFAKPIKDAGRALSEIAAGLSRR